MKKRLFSALSLVALTLAACGSNNNDTDNSTRRAEQSTTTENAHQTVPGANLELVKFPENYDEGELFTTVTRGSTYEEVYTSREAIEAVQDGQPMPSGTVITLKIFKDEELYRYFVMEKRDGWGAQYPTDMRNGEWEYNAFTADGGGAYQEDIGRCFSCHANQERDEFVNKYDDMKSYEFEDVTGSKDSRTVSQIAGIPTNHWKVKAVDDYLGGSRDILHGNSLMEDEEKAEIIQKVLLMIHFNQEI
ncbi:Cytochrome P460 [Bacillus sp. OK838]|nr:Cytochrome P460 [Bacillus sp. OK838]